MSAFLAGRANPLTFERFSTALLLLVLTLTACLMPAQTDTWWQLRAGEVMWQSHHVMLRDEFSHTVSGGYWPNHEWLAQVLFYAAYKAGGLPLLTALCAAVVTACWAVVASLTPAPRGVRLVLLGAGAVMTSPAWSLRPQVFTPRAGRDHSLDHRRPAPSLDACARVRRLGKSSWWRLARESSCSRRRWSRR